MSAAQQTIGDLVRANAQFCPDRAAVVFPDEQATYAELAERVDALSRTLIALDVGAGECVGVLMHNSLDMVVSLLACASIGAICVPVNVRNRGKELAYVLEDAQLRVLLVNALTGDYPDLLARLAEALPDLDDVHRAPLALGSAPRLRRVLVYGAAPVATDVSTLSALASSVSDAAYAQRRAAVSVEDAAMMLYTSGTTSMPKGCPWLHRQLLSISAQIGERLGAREADRVWGGLPLFHASGIVPMLMTMQVHGTFLSQHHFDAGVALSMIKSHQATLAWPAFNTIWQEILVHPEFQPSALGSLRAVLCVGPGETVRMMESIAPSAPLLSCYGITEGLGVPIMVRHDDDAWTRTESGGRPFDGIEVVVRDPETGVDLPHGALRGELWLRGTNVFGGYWRDEQKTRESFDADGWFNTGDLASIDENELVYYHGRVKDMLKVGGENVAAVEIEAHLSTHPAVKLAALVGRPDAKYGEVPVAFIELRPGHDASESELIEFCVGQIASFKVPRQVRFVTEWPMSATKIRKTDLRDIVALEPSA